MAGELFPFDEVVRIGDPWHGLVVGGQINLPNGQTRPYVGDAPQGGDAYKIKIPDYPAVTTSATDQALGMQWLNFGILAGRNRVIYGKTLSGSWFYIDPAGARWRISCSSGTDSVNVTLVSADNTVSQVISNVPLSPLLHADLRVSLSGKPIHVVDISSTGRKAILTWDDTDSPIPVDGEAMLWNPQAIALLEVSGTPPSATATFTKLRDRKADGDPFEEYGTPNSYHVTEWQKFIINGSDPVAYMSRYREYDSATGVEAWPTPDGHTFYNAGYGLQRNNDWNTRWLRSYAFDESDALVAVKIVKRERTVNYGTYVAGIEVSQSETGYIEYMWRIEVGSSVSPWHVMRSGVAASPALPFFDGKAVRYSNKCYGVRAQMENGSLQWHQPAAPSGAFSGDMIVFDASGYSALRPYASADPISGVVAFRTEPCCYK